MVLALAIQEISRLQVVCVAEMITEIRQTERVAEPDACKRSRRVSPESHGLGPIRLMVR
jgi:hypothetical protein